MFCRDVFRLLNYVSTTINISLDLHHYNFWQSYDFESVTACLINKNILKSIIYFCLSGNY